MISLRQAFDLVMTHTQRLPVETVPLLQAHGRILAVDICADRDLPPFPRSSMDGYAVRSADLVAAPVRLQVIASITAGTFPDFELQPGQAAKIMTGAPVPDGADAVQIIEKTRMVAASGQVEILAPVAPGVNIAPRGSETREGEVVLRTGTFLSAAALGLLATVGGAHVDVFRAPTVGILATGDELVEIESQPRAAQIRNSNSYGLYSQVLLAGGVPFLLGIARDHSASLAERIQAGRPHDLLLLTGGVSMGQLDLVKPAFGQFGFEIHFDKVAVKPGKPVVFAQAGAALVFGLPGNPVSAATTFELLVRPAIRKMMGFAQVENPRVTARLAEDFHNRSGREVYAPAHVWYDEGAFQVRPLPAKGSADVVTYAMSNACLVCPLEKARLAAGETVTVMLRSEYFYH